MSLPSSPEERLRIVATTREVAAETLLETFLSESDEISEKEFASAWLRRLRRRETLLPEGWYQPPPLGVVVLFGQPPSFDRLQFASLRAKEHWPQDIQYLGKEQLVYAYCSPVHRDSGLIGDLAVTLYRGSGRAVRQHIASALQITADIVAHAEVGMPLSALYAFAKNKIERAGLINRTLSITHSHGLDIGHTVPWSDGDQSELEKNLLGGRDMSAIWDLIRSRRSFVDATSDLLIESNMAFTIEPKIASPALPTVSFHVIVMFVNGQKTIASSYRSLFDHFGMRDYLPREALSVLDCLSSP